MSQKATNLLVNSAGARPVESEAVCLSNERLDEDVGAPSDNIPETYNPHDFHSDSFDEESHIHNRVQKLKSAKTRSSVRRSAKKPPSKRPKRTERRSARHRMASTINAETNLGIDCLRSKKR